MLEKIFVWAGLIIARVAVLLVIFSVATKSNLLLKITFFVVFIGFFCAIGSLVTFIIKEVITNKKDSKG